MFVGYKFDKHWTFRLNVENLLDRRYYATSHGNNNILPGAPRSLKLSVTTGL